ncbi:MAG: hypothetical protein QOG49_880, partial [Frankiaceae bacterium]|nr:hypothetical protein [Frankiaceae bacterium]
MGRVLTIADMPASACTASFHIVVRLAGLRACPLAGMRSPCSGRGGAEEPGQFIRRCGASRRTLPARSPDRAALPTTEQSCEFGPSLTHAGEGIGRRASFPTYREPVRPRSLPVRLARTLGLLATLSALLCGAPVVAQAADGWSPVTGDIGQIRVDATATALSDGKVLIAGGTTASGVPTASAVLYDPATNTLSATGSMFDARGGATAALTDAGTVLIVGGKESGGGELNSSELYHEQTGTFTRGPSMVFARYGHVEVPVSNGDVLVAGGDGGDADSTTELYNAGSNTFRTGPALGRASFFASGTELSTGNALIAGGQTVGGYANHAQEFLWPSSIYDLGSLNTPTVGHTATLLNDGTVLITGGLDVNGSPSARAELYDSAYDPTPSPFTAVGSMHDPRAYGAAALLPSGKVLVGGGYASNRTDLYDPTTKTFSAGAPMLEGRDQPLFAETGSTANRVLATAGWGSTSAEVYGHLPQITLRNNLIVRGSSGAFDLAVNGQTVKSAATAGESGATPVYYHSNVTLSAVAANGANPSDYALRIDCGAAGAGNGSTLTLTGVSADTTCQMTETDPTITVINALSGAPGAGHFDLKVGSSTVRTSAVDGEQGQAQVAYRSTTTVSENASPGTDQNRYDVAIDCGAAGSGSGTSLALDPVADATTCTITNERRPLVTLRSNLAVHDGAGQFDLQLNGQTVKAAAADGEGGSSAVGYSSDVTVSAVAANGANPADYALRIDCGASGVANGSSLTLSGVAADTTCELTESDPTITVINTLAGPAHGGRFDLEVGGLAVHASAGDGERGQTQVAYRSTQTVSES